MKELKVRVRHRYHPSELWHSINPILQAGEIGVESDTGKFKYGNGRDKWDTLDYAYGSGVRIDVYNSIDDLPDANLLPGAIVIVPRDYTINGQNLTIDTPYISLRKNNNYMWTIFADQKDKPLVNNILDAFVLDVSPLG